MREALPSLTGATVHVHLQCRLSHEGQGGQQQIEDWCLVGWHANGRPVTRAEVPLDGEAFLTSLDFGDLPGALVVLRQALPGARIRVAGACDAAWHQEPFFQASRSLRRQPMSEPWCWDHVGTDFLPVSI